MRWESRIRINWWAVLGLVIMAVAIFGSVTFIVAVISLFMVAR